MKLKKTDIILIAAVLVVALAGSLILYINNNSNKSKNTESIESTESIDSIDNNNNTEYVTENKAYVVVRVGNTETERLPLDEDTELDIAGYNGGYNHLVIKDGYAYISEADCPGSDCVFQPDIQNDSEWICCTPHQVFITIDGGEQSDIDGVAK